MTGKLAETFFPLVSLLIFVGLVLAGAYLVTGASANETVIYIGSTFNSHPYVSAFTAVMAIFGGALMLIRVVEAMNPGNQMSDSHVR